MKIHTDDGKTNLGVRPITVTGTGGLKTSIKQDISKATLTVDPTNLLSTISGTYETSAHAAATYQPIPTYQSYTPTWTSDGTQPAVGNATVLGRYTQIGKFVHCYGVIAFGSTTTFGTGDYFFSLPVNSKLPLSVTRNFGSVQIRCAGGNAQAQAEQTTGSTGPGNFYIVLPSTYLGSQGIVTATFPGTFANGDWVAWNITYEAA